MITTAWAIAFTLTCIAVTLVYLIDPGNVLEVVAQVAGFVIPITFTNWYKERAANDGAPQQV